MLRKGKEKKSGRNQVDWATVLEMTLTTAGNSTVEAKSWLWEQFWRLIVEEHMCPVPIKAGGPFPSSIHISY